MRRSERRLYHEVNECRCTKSLLRERRRCDIPLEGTEVTESPPFGHRVVEGFDHEGSGHDGENDSKK